ncbi:MAG: PHP domain-containing protein [Candidatus Nealsonbacteria bacterium]|nr:PHP domain-containing protein [Candidatus Nealsonbacteria bacterium]
MKCDLHVHTSYSYDSTSAPAQIIEQAKKKGIKCLAIADHDEIKGAGKVKELAEGQGILIIPSIEIKSRQGDILGLNVKQVIPSGLSVSESVERIKRQGGLAIIPHPFALFYPFKGELEEHADQIDGVEILNASVVKDANRRAQVFAKKHQLAFTAGSDAHSPEEVGKVYLEIPGESLSLNEVLTAIMEKRGKLGGKEANLLEKGLAFLKRSAAKINSYLC